MSLWKFQITTKLGYPDPQGDRIRRHLSDFGVTCVQEVRSSRLFIIQFATQETASDQKQAARRIADELLTDPIVETCVVTHEGAPSSDPCDALAVEVFFKPGVMDNVAQSTTLALVNMGFDVESVRTARRYELRPAPAESDRARLPRLLANDCVEDVFLGGRPITPPPSPPVYEFRLRHVPILSLDRAGLEKLSREADLFLSADEMITIQAHFKRLERDPTDLELETLAQTWSEHCVHKTLKSAIDYGGAAMPEANAETLKTQNAKTEQIELRYDNLLKDTIARATRELMQERRGPECLSVFVDNAGVVGFDEEFGVAFKVETHNHPSALEPYGGASTGVGGCIRDVMGCGLGAKPIANTDVFCVAPPDWPIDRIPKGIIHPRTMLKGITSGVRDYGNRMGIPTVNGAVHFDPRYLGNPLVYCGCVGLIPRDRLQKAARPGDAIVVLGGRTGRDGIHGATFSSAELTDAHEDEFSHAVQIGNAVEEKKVLDVILQARDYRDVNNSNRLASRCLFSAITDCGAGGLSSAIGEMAAETGAEVHLDRVPLKYAGLRHDEIWISEAQERMVLAVPPENVDVLLRLARSEDVEATVIGHFTDTNRLIVHYNGTIVGELNMQFLHEGLPKTRLSAEWYPQNIDKNNIVKESHSKPHPSPPLCKGRESSDLIDALKRKLGQPTIASKHWLIRQYDHEVQGGSVVKPMVGRGEGPSDAAVVRPRLDSNRGIALGCGLAPQVGDVDPYWMAIAAIDEAIRNVVCVGGDPAATAILDNFCWPAAQDARSLGALVRACQACYDGAKAYGVPFISGKDSLNNVFAMNDATDALMVLNTIRERYPEFAGAVDGQQLNEFRRLSIPYTLLISALALVKDVNRCITSVPRLIANEAHLFYVGTASSCWEDVSLASLSRLHNTVAQLIRDGVIVAAHDCSDGGVAVAVTEMAIASELETKMFVPEDGSLFDPFVEPTSGYVVQAKSSEALGAIDEIEGMIVQPIAVMQGVDSGPIFSFARYQSNAVESLERILCQTSLAELNRAWRTPLNW